MAASSEARVVVTSLGGESIAELSPPPATVEELKMHIRGQRGHPLRMQRLITEDHRLLQDEENLLPSGTEAARLDLTFVVDETPLFTWDIQGNPHGHLLAGQDGVVVYKSSQYDFVNVLTEEPVCMGTHFYEFVMHQIRDEQWCGVTAHQQHAGSSEVAKLGTLTGWFYYCGRRYASEGALHAGIERRRVEGKTFGHVKDGDTIGMLLDMDHGGVAFSLNDVVQGACRVPKVPLYVTTRLDREEDHVELRKPPVASAPVEAAEIIAAAVAEEDLIFVDAVADPRKAALESTEAMLTAGPCKEYTTHVAVDDLWE